MNVTTSTLADGREIIYFDDHELREGERVLHDSRDLPHTQPLSEIRHDPLTNTWVAYAAHRMNRTFMPPANENPLAPTTPGNLPTEIPSPTYDVVVFENRFPSFSMNIAVGEDWESYVDGIDLYPRRPALARCEVVCFTPDVDKSFKDLPVSRIRTVINAWAHRTEALSALSGVQQVFPFENRGEEIGVTLQHPHGQIYSYPFLSPRLQAIVQSAQYYAETHDGHDLFDAIIREESAVQTRVIERTEHFIVFVPAAAKWPVEAMVMPLRAVADFTELTDVERDDLAALLKRLYTAVDSFFEGVAKTPYIAGWTQAPVDPALRPFGRLHLQLFSLMRSPNRMKFLAGSESSQGVWINDTTPERIAQRFKEVWPHATLD
ncbi:galactose-1-phosphate uridylyltransferase [Corynebacterium diphtheriae bv. mitis]|uniref:galactose-1-phosphate uridylyltransferase n=1 Tax=Corynebacterium diphtheriae TaxID=1717 RepID=UPI0013CB6057|nr:galactose-1-phosphate uridylyltransferase [Corynebacterium diphtheriae]MBG9357983.1 galactose-1-phosphate uridylyltransferase [Corynebacterium diphtheriae bv. mitis]MBG9360147.1 galactose-1-phosphate uridylyltransferase [Corynebacterium diphtheriae bv. mitis]MBG9362310.1 galactose-1-phosphate uridylyltransferase [Corynebacterium diphtheriae bv. mitis]MBG9364479.1 galactose-1-phosphate uridylyltransferase [Corynebacterium diphtheriae bv. mitis]MCS6571948.1 galactose-1-phosphate uridylyltrans